VARAWLDTGTFATMMQAAEFVARVVEERQGIEDFLVRKRSRGAAAGSATTKC